MAAVLDAPVLFQLTPGNGSVTLRFFLPSNTSLTDVLYSTNDGAFLSLGAISGLVTITKESDSTTDLVNDTAYSIKLVGVSNEYPLSDDSLRSPPSIFTPVATAGKPSAPQILSFSSIGGSIDINYLLGSNGGSAVTGVFYTTDGGSTYGLLPGAIDGSSTITTMSNGDQFPINEPILIALVSLNAIEPLPENNVLSAAIIATMSSTIQPADSPVIRNNTPGNQELTVAYELGSDGGSDFVTVYYSTDDGKNWKDSLSKNGTVTILEQSDNSLPLVNGTFYQVRLLVTTISFPEVDPQINIPSSRVDMSPTGAGVVAPDPPSIGTYTPGDKKLIVPYTLGSDGGSSVLKVFYSTDDTPTWFDTGSTNGNAEITALSTDGTTPLVNGTEYPVRLVVTTVDFPDEEVNPPSTPVFMTPTTNITRPGVVNINSVAIGDASLEISYSTTSTGGSTINQILYSTDAGLSWLDSGNTSGTFTILTGSNGYALENGTTYYLLLAAATEDFPDFLNNPIPNSATPATPQAPGTPASRPSAPTIDSVNIGDKSITLSYSIPTDGGSPIKNVYYTTDGGTTWQPTGEQFPFGSVTITTLSTDGTTLLTNGTEYLVQLVAQTDAFGMTDNPRSVMQKLTPRATPVAPDAPIINLTSAGMDSFQIDYVLGSDGGSSIIDVQYTTDDGVNWLTTGNTSGTAIITTDSQGGAFLQNVPYSIRLVCISESFQTPGDNPLTDVITLQTNSGQTSEPNPPVITSHTPGDGQLEVFFTLDSAGTGILQDILYSTDGSTWISTGVTSGSFIMTVDSNGDLLVNNQTYTVQIVAITSDYPDPVKNIPSGSVPMTPLSAPVAPFSPAITEYSPGNKTLTINYILGSNGGSPYTNLWYSTNDGINWKILDVNGPIDTSNSAIISTLSTGATLLTNDVTYSVRLMATTVQFPTPTNLPSDSFEMTPSGTSQRPSAPVITSWFGLHGELVVRYTIPSDGGSPVTAVYYSTDSGLSWDTTTSPNGTAIIRMTSGRSGPIVDSTTYGVRLLAITVDFPLLSNPYSSTVYMVARPTIPGTFKPKGMSYTEFLRSKKNNRVKILNTKPVRTASEITNARRLGASRVFALNNEAVKGSITTPIDFSQGGLHAARSYFKEGGTSRRVGSASEFTAFSGSQAIGGLVQAGLPPTRIVQESNFILVSAPVPQGVSDYLRRDQGCKTSLGQQHDLAKVTPPIFVDNTVRNTGSPACVTRPAIHDIKAKNAFAYVPNRPSQAEGQYALKGDLEPGKELGGYGGKLPTHLKINKPITTLCSRTGANPNYKAGAAIDDIPYVEKHHGNDLGVNPKRPFVKYQIPAGATPVHLKANKPINTI
jgi:hypothetical protein